MTQPPKTPSTVRTVPVGDVSLAVTEYQGDGPPLVLLHGIGSRATSWWDVVDALSPHARLIVPDHRGHGGSDKPATGYLMIDYARDLEGLLSAYDLERPRILGHSLGGLIALEWARTSPDRADRLIIEDSPLRGAEDPAALFNGWISLATMSVPEAAATYAAQHPTWSPEDCERRAESITGTTLSVFTELRDINLSRPQADRISPYARITSPILLVHGDTASGGMVVEADARRFGELLPNATVRRIPGGSHSLHRDHTDEFLAAVIPFLNAA